MVVAAGKQLELDSIRRSPHAPPSAGSSDRPSIHRCERSSPVKNRKLEICTSGSVRGRGGNIPTYSASCRGQQGLGTTCKDSPNEAKCRRRREPNGSGEWFGLKDHEHMLEGMRKAGWCE